LSKGKNTAKPETKTVVEGKVEKGKISPVLANPWRKAFSGVPGTIDTGYQEEVE